MTINLYTLPTCGICHMIKTKMADKKINFKEYNLADYIKELNTDRAPVLQVIQNEQQTLYTSPSAIVQWINEVS